MIERLQRINKNLSDYCGYNVSLDFRLHNSFGGNLIIRNIKVINNDDNCQDNQSSILKVVLSDTFNSLEKSKDRKTFSIEYKYSDVKITCFNGLTGFKSFLSILNREVSNSIRKQIKCRNDVKLLREKYGQDTVSVLARKINEKL